MGYKSHAQRKAVHASKADGGKGNPNKKSPAKNKGAISKTNKISAKKSKYEKAGDEAVLSGKMRKAARKYKRADKLAGKETKNKKMIQRALKNQMSPLKLEKGVTKDKLKTSKENKQQKGLTASELKLRNKKKASALKMKTSPALAKLSASCKAAAKRKFKVYPSAYANMWAAKTQRKGKC